MSRMTRPQPPAVRSLFLGLTLPLACLPTAATAAGPSSSPSPSSRPSLSVVERTVDQEQGSWLVNYRLRYRGATGLVVTPTEVLVKLEGWVSNSRVPAHAVPRLSTLVVSGASGLSGLSDVVNAADESQRCRERAVVQVWIDDPRDDAAPPLPAPATAPGSEPRQPILSIAPGATVRVRLKLDHVHVLYGDYDPLLGARALEVQLGAASFRDVLPTDREQYLAQAKCNWTAPPEDRRDTRHFLSAPDSLHLEAHVPGNQNFRFPERPVRYDTKMRLRYWYFVADGTEGECRARITQSKETPTMYRVLSEGGREECLTTVGRWVKVDRVFRTEPDATTLTLDFRIASNSEVGEMWIDDVRLEPVACSAPAGP